MCSKRGDFGVETDDIINGLARSLKVRSESPGDSVPSFVPTATETCRPGSLRLYNNLPQDYRVCSCLSVDERLDTRLLTKSTKRYFVTE